MNFGFKTALILFSVSIALGAFPIDEVSAQGPLVKGLRNRLNNGKPLIPFVGDMEQAFRPQPQPPNRLSPAAAAAKKPTPAAKPNPAGRTPAPSSRVPTPATRRPTPATPTPASRASGSGTKYPPIKLESPERTAAPATAEKPTQKLAAAGFGMSIQQYGEGFVVAQVDPRGNAAAEGVRRGDVIENIGGAPIRDIAEYEAVGKAMSGGDRVEFELSRRGSKPQKMMIQFGKAAPVPASEPMDVAPNLEPAPSEPIVTQRRERYEPTGSGLKSIYESGDTPSSILSPTPAPTPANRVQSLGELDYPALEIEK